jgi:ABC-type multidrug transport system fused ATPase/permease subunit
MQTGVIIESGTHDNLLGTNGVYKKIYDLQTSN